MFFELLFQTQEAIQNETNWDLKSKVALGIFKALKKSKIIDSKKNESIQFCKMNTETTVYLLTKATECLFNYCNYGGIDNSKLQLD